MPRIHKIWREISKVGTEDINFRTRIGARITPSVLLNDNSITNGAICFGRDVNGDLYVGQYYQKFLKVSDNLHIVGTLPIDVEDPTPGNDGISYVRGFAFNESYLAVVCQIRHLVKIYRKSDYSVVSQIGIYDDLGDPTENKLSDPRDVLWLDNGNLLVVSNQGFANGHCSEYDLDGNLIAVRLSSQDDGFSDINTSNIRSPTAAKLDPNDNNFIWITESEGEIVKVDTTNWKIVDVVYPTPGIDSTSIEGFCFNDQGNIVIASVDFGGILEVNPNTKQVINTVDVSWFKSPRDVRDVIHLNDDLYGIATWSDRNLERGVYIVSTNKSISVEYSNLDIPEGYEIVYDLAPSGYANNQIEYPVTRIDDVLEKVVIPLKLKCQ